MRNLYILSVIFLVGCGSKPGDVKDIENGTIYHLSQGVLVEEYHNGSNYYYVINNDLAKSYELDGNGLNIKFKRNKTVEKSGDMTTTTRMKYIKIKRPAADRFSISSANEMTARALTTNAAVIVQGLTAESTPEEVIRQLQP